MFEQQLKMSYVIKRIQKNRFKKILDRYANYLFEKRYSAGSIRHYRCAVEHFFNWLELKKITVISKVNKHLTNAFIKKHIPRCQCHTPAPKRISDLNTALNLLLKIIEKQSAIKPRLSTTDVLLNDFERYLLDICGLAEETRKYHRRHLKFFINNYFHSKQIQLNKLTPIDVRLFLYKKLKNYKKRTFGLFVYSIRTFFKFLQFKGIGNKLLIESLPRIIEWKCTGIPEALSKKELTRLLKVFNRSTPLGKRDYAMMTCMLELGLRAGEIAQLRLDEMNWRTKTIKLSSSKSRQPYEMPMTQRMMDALIDYLCFGRPYTASRYIFVYHRAPVGQKISRFMVSGVAYRAINRSGLRLSYIGSAQLLRRTFATNLLRKGSSIKEISDLLRHRSIDTTALYIKADLTKLRQVALPWLKEAV